MLKFDDFLNEKKLDKLSGIVLIVDDKILLVKPKKYKKVDNMWSIPKGHLEDDLSNLETALLELSEETGISLNIDDVSIRNKSNIFYKKSGVIKRLKYFVIVLENTDLKKYLNDVKKLKLKNYKSKEITKSKFFTKKEAEKRLEPGQFAILKELK
jgi:8-oxo-dGTP pyrophosphatase MutT (NUDIX family)